MKGKRKEDIVKPRPILMSDELYFDLEYLAKDPGYDTTTNFIRTILQERVDEEKRKRKVSMLPRLETRINKQSKKKK